MSVLSHLAKCFFALHLVVVLEWFKSATIEWRAFSVALSFGRWVIVPPRRKRAAELRNIFVLSPDLNCWGWMIEQRKSWNIWAVAILQRSGVFFYGIQARKASSLNNWSEKESWLNLWWIQEDLLSLQQKSHLSALALALFCYPPYCKVGFFVPFWDYFGTSD